LELASTLAIAFLRVGYFSDLEIASNVACFRFASELAFQ
jgi:hypothetical protein